MKRFEWSVEAVEARGLGVLFAAGSLLLGVVGAARAQSVADSASPEEITVTGTRIRMTDGMAEPVPVTTLTPDELELFAPGGTVAEQLDALPQFFLTTTAQRGGPALFGPGGGSYLNMRGLGAERTLVLFDGFRMPPADKRGSVNVDTFPTALIRSVDVVTGGASAAYGADAIGGVTNFILDREFEGLKFSAGTGVNDFNSDGKNWDTSVAGGMHVGERLNIIGSFEARHVDQIVRLAEDLDPSWFQRWGHVTNPAYRQSDPPGTNPQRVTVPWVAPAGLHVNGKLSVPGAPGQPPPVSALNNMKFTDDGRAIVPFDRGTLSDASWISGGSDAAIANRTLAGGPSGSEVVQQTAFFGLKYAVTDSIEIFADVLVGHVESNSQQVFTGASMSGPWSATVFRENAYLPASVAAIMAPASAANPTGENRASFLIAKGASYPGELDIYNTSESRNEFDSESLRFGLNWTLNDNWDMRLSLQSGETEKMTGTFDALRIDRLALAIDAVEIYSDRRDVTSDTGTGPPDGRPDLVPLASRGTGTIVCNVQRYNPTPAQLASVGAIQGKTKTTVNGTVPLASPIGLDNTISGCVPFNIMGHGQITPEAADYITTPKWGIGIVEQDFAEVLFRGTLSDGWGAGPLSLATGLTYRDQSFSDGAYPVEIDELGPPFNADGRTAAAMPNLGIRGIATTWSTGSPNLHQFSTVSAISGGYDVWEAFGELNMPLWQSSSRERNLGSSFAYRSSDYSSVGRVESWKVGLDFQMFRDLRLRATRSRDVREATFSERFDLSPGGGSVFDTARNNQQSTVTITTDGNPDLRPEVADTSVIGLVYQPGGAPGLRMSIDEYEVDIADSIATLGAQEVVRQCAQSGVLCENVFRDDLGVLSRVLSPYLNLDLARARGVDVEVSYRRDVNFFSSQEESLSLRVLGGKLLERTSTVVGSTPAEFAGTRGYPDVTVNVTAAYNVGSWSFQLQERFIDEVLLNRMWVEGVDVDDNTIDSQAWTDLVVGYAGQMRGTGAWRVSFNIQNLFDKDPPIIPSSLDSRFGAQAIDNTYENWGRRYQLGFKMEF
jgi:iron complex outermembrane receptor protein